MFAIACKHLNIFYRIILLFLLQILQQCVVRKCSAHNCPKLLNINLVNLSSCYFNGFNGIRQNKYDIFSYRFVESFPVWSQQGIASARALKWFVRNTVHSCAIFLTWCRNSSALKQNKSSSDEHNEKYIMRLPIFRMENSSIVDRT